ncbi:hypothetical protein M422DRAFT_242127 [Sphaerobolus stellatus SS14]|nr:hypothetical protein M422DRAFT_242127 [Sphaerobolus stellatus SS14]
MHLPSLKICAEGVSNPVLLVLHPIQFQLKVNSRCSRDPKDGLSHNNGDTTEILPYDIKCRPLPSFMPIPETPSPSRPPALMPLYVSTPRTPSGNWRTSSIIRERAARENVSHFFQPGIKSDNEHVSSPMPQKDRASSKSLQLPVIEDGRNGSDIINNEESQSSCSQFQFRDVFTEADYALARAAEKLVQRRKELQEYRTSVQRHMNGLIKGVEEVEEYIFHELLKAVAPQQKDFTTAGHGQFDGPQGLLYRVVFDLRDMYEQKRAGIL